MKPRNFILVSPGAIDGYPPVQHQAQLLLGAGHKVEVVTTPMRVDHEVPDYRLPGARISGPTGQQAMGSGRLTRMWHFSRALCAARKRAGKDAIEICYDPIGVLYSDFAPAKPAYRIAHLHELLQELDKFLEKRLKGSLRKFDIVVVPDEGRAAHTRAALDMATAPLVIENYPLLGTCLEKQPKDRFEVVYCGSLGLQQKLDVAIRSIPLWPDHADLVLIGNDKSRVARNLRDVVAEVGMADRVHFLGWMLTEDAERRVAQSDLGVALLDGDLEQWRTALGASNKRFQYMKAALPQVGDQNPGVPELIEGNEIGLCVADHTPDQIAACVTTYATDPARQQSEGQRAFDVHCTHYNYQAVFPRLLDRLTELGAL